MAPFPNKSKGGVESLTTADPSSDLLILQTAASGHIKLKELSWLTCHLKNISSQTKAGTAMKSSSGFCLYQLTYQLSKDDHVKITPDRSGQGS
jgi:hypothetical protein